MPDDAGVELEIILVEIAAFTLQEELQYSLFVVHPAQLAGDDGAPERLLRQGAVAPPVQPVEVLVLLLAPLLRPDELVARGDASSVSSHCDLWRKTSLNEG